MNHPYILSWTTESKEEAIEALILSLQALQIGGTNQQNSPKLATTWCYFIFQSSALPKDFTFTGLGKLDNFGSRCVSWCNARQKNVAKLKKDFPQAKENKEIQW